MEEQINNLLYDPTIGKLATLFNGIAVIWLVIKFLQKKLFKINDKMSCARLHLRGIAKIEAKKPKMYEGAISKGLEVDAEVIHSQKPNKVKIYVKGYEDKLFDMSDSAQQPKGYICRVSLVIANGKILRVIYKIPK